MEIQHLTLTSKRRSRHALFTDEATYREALIHLGQVAARASREHALRLALLGFVDDHLHLLPRGPRAAAGRLAQATSCSLKTVVATPLAPTDFAPVETRSHLRWLVRYFLEQASHHGLPLSTHPALFVGCCLPDLLGARRIDGLELCISEVLTRFHPGMALEILGLPTGPLLPADNEAVRSAGAARIVAASSAAFAAPPAMEGKSALVMRARTTAIQLARQTGIAPSDIAWALRLSSRSVRRLTATGSDKEDVLVVRRRIALEDRAQGTRLVGRKQGG